MFSVHTTPEKFEKKKTMKQRKNILNVRFRKTEAGEYHGYSDAIVYETLKMFPVSPH